MIYELLHFYKKSLSNSKMVFKKIRFWHYIFIISPFILSSIVIIFSIINREFYETVFTISMFVPFIIMFFLINNKTKEIVHKEYNVISDEFSKSFKENK